MPEDGVGADKVDAVVVLVLSQRGRSDLEVGDVGVADRCGLDALDDRLDDAVDDADDDDGIAGIDSLPPFTGEEISLLWL